MHSVRARQIHLDFHTSERIPGVGAKFDKRQWQKALKLGRVQTINIFAKCHHGWSYYPTAVGKPHPQLSIPDLMGAQIEACQEIGVVAPLYFTVGWSVHDANTHPEWTVRDRQGNPVAVNVDPAAKPGDPRPFCSWVFLCPSGGYLKQMLAQTEELVTRYPHADGLWYDINNGPWNPEGPVCYCETCQRGMRAEGVAIDDTPAVANYAIRKWKHFFGEARRIAAAHLKDPVVFFNGTTFTSGQNRKPMWEHNTQQDLEDLPTTWGGYNKFPLRARFFCRTGQPYVAMSGKFHTSWGEFGGFKHPDALRFEAAAMIAYGARCNFGDQLHPSGEMDLATYRNVGEAFRYVERIEEYGLDGRPRATLGLWWGDATTTSTGRFAAEPNHQGVTEMLLENQIDFEIVDQGDDLGRFAAIILAGAACLDDAAAAALGAYRAGGGKLLVLGEGGLDAATRSRFALEVGATYAGPSTYRQDYLLVRGGKLAKNLVASPFVCHDAAIRATVTTGTVLAAIREPYFDRTYGAYSSHMNTPFQLEDAAHPGAWALKDLVYLAHPVGYLYTKEGARLHREYFLNALRLVYPVGKQTVAAVLPSGGRVSLVHQPDRRRYCAHLLYGPPTPRGRCQIIEDLVPLHDVPLTLRVPETIRRVRLPVHQKTLRATAKARAVRVVVPTLQGHEVVVFEY